MSSENVNLDLEIEFEKYSKGKRMYKTWQKVVSILAAITIFVTTYVLILPAITLDKESAYVCGKTEHTHDESCFVNVKLLSFTCRGGLHTHTEECFAEDGTCLCGKADYAIHTHNESCYDENGSLRCPLPEISEHTHTDECFTEEKTLICTLEENETHTHTDECYETKKVCVCGKDSPVFVENETAEAVFHEHTEECFDENGALICTETEILRHEHSEECRQESEEPRLICDREEHIHTDACLPSDREVQNDYGYFCGYAYEHKHTPACYNEGVLICNRVEHTHTLACLSNSTEDVETEDHWTRSVERAVLTGDAAHDLLAIAESQIGYHESVKNYVLSQDNDVFGYNRYGAWYGDAYGGWNTMFIAFCLNYAHVTGISAGNTVETLVEDAIDEDLYRDPDEYEPKPGDIIVYRPVGDGLPIGFVDTVRAGIVVSSENGVLKTVEGDVDGEVAYRELTADDAVVECFCEVVTPEKSSSPIGSDGETAGEADISASATDMEITLTAAVKYAMSDEYVWQWQVSDNGTDGWTDIDGENSLSLVLTNNSYNASRYYRIIGKRIEEETAPETEEKSTANSLLSALLPEANAAELPDEIPDEIPDDEDGIVSEDVIISAAVSPRLLLGAASSSQCWKKVMTTDELTSDGVYMIVSVVNGKAIGLNTSNKVGAVDPELTAVDYDGDGDYYYSDIGSRYWWNFSTDGTSSKQTVSYNPSYGIYLGSSSSYGLVATNSQATTNTLTLQSSQNGRWYISRARTSGNTTTTYYVAASGDSFAIATSNTNARLYIYKQVEDPTAEDDPGTDDPGTDDPGTGGVTIVKPTYPPYTPTSGAKTGETMIGDVPGQYWSDPATSQLENDRYFAGRSADDGKVLSDKSVVYGDDDYGAFEHYDPNTFGVALSVLGQDYAITEEINVKVPIDVVFVLDTSGSMINTTYNGKTSANIMIESLNEIMASVLDSNEDNRVGVVCYSGDGTRLLDLGRYTAPNDEFFEEGKCTSADYVLTANSSIRRTDGTLNKGSFTGGWYGTYTQDGIANGAQEFLEADTTVTRTVSKQTDEGVVTATYTATRRPIFILLSDGEPTYCTEDYTNVLATTKVHGNGNTGYNNNGTVVSDTSPSYNNNKGILGYYTILSAQYYKDQIARHYNTDAYFYTIGIGIDEQGNDSYEKSIAGDDYKRAVLNPTAANIRHLANCTNGHCLDSGITSANNDISGKTTVTCRQLYQLLNNSYSGSTVNISNSKIQYGLAQATTSSTPVINNPYRTTGYSYADGAFFSTDTSVTELTEAFSNAIGFSEYFPVYGFILKMNTDICVSDTIGDGMEIKGEPVLNYGGENYQPVSHEVDGNTTIYHYAGTYTAADGSGRSTDLSDCYAYVVSEADGSQRVEFYIPDSSLPTYSPNLKNDGTSYFYYESLPARLIYQVGLTAQSEQDIQAANGSGESFTFYTNAWDDDNYTYATFLPTTKNPYYKNNAYDKTSQDKTDNNTDTYPEAWDYDDGSTASNVGIHQGNNGKLVFTTEIFTRVPITVYKVDEDGEPITTDTAEFEVYSDQTLTTLVGSFETDKSGSFVINNLQTNRTYYLKETKAPEGYELKTDVIPFTLDVDGNITGLDSTNIYLTKNDDGQLLFRNDYKQTDITVRKVWSGELGAGESHPTSVYVRLCADGSPIRDQVMLRNNNNWTYTWTDLPMISQADKHEIRYTVIETGVPTGYVLNTSTDDDGVIVLNNQKIGKTSLSVCKKWEGTAKPIVVELLANGKPTGRYVTLSDDNDWYYTWTDLDSVDENGNVTYSVREIPGEGYDADVHLWTGPGDPYGSATTSVTQSVTQFTNGKQYVLTVENGTVAIAATSANQIGPADYTPGTVPDDSLLWTATINGNNITFTNVKYNKVLRNSSGNYVTIAAANGDQTTWYRYASSNSYYLRAGGSNGYYLRYNNGTFSTVYSYRNRSQTFFYEVTQTSTEDTRPKGDTHYIIVNTETTTGTPIELTFTKVSEIDRTHIISGAEFELYRETGNTEDTAIPGTSNRCGVLVEDWTSRSSAKEIMIESNGVYYLCETKAPKGYEPLGIPIVFEVTTENGVRKASVVYHPSNEAGTEFTDMTIPNAYDGDIRLPSTGGMGTTVFTVFGTALIASSAVLYLRRRKKALL